MRLSEADLDRLQRTILCLHEIRGAEEFRRAAPGLFLSVIPADWFVLMDARIYARRSRVTMCDCLESPKVLDDDLVWRMECVAYRLSRHVRRTGTCTALTFPGFFSMARRPGPAPGDGSCREAPGGRLLATASLRPAGITTLNAARPAGRTGFTERDRLMLNLMRPHFELARRTAEREAAAERARAVRLEAFGLTAREREVADWLAKGKANLEISLILGMRARTVEKHVEHILAKLGVENRTAAAVVIAHCGDP